MASRMRILDGISSLTLEKDLVKERIDLAKAFDLNKPSFKLHFPKSKEAENLPEIHTNTNKSALPTDMEKLLEPE